MKISRAIAVRNELSDQGAKAKRIRYPQFELNYKPKIMMDSGAYTAWKAGTDIDVAVYGDFLHQYKDKIDCYISLDKIDKTDPVGAAKISRKNLKYLQKRGLDPIPVLHAMDDIHELEWMLESGASCIALAANSQLAGIRSGLEWYDIVWNYLVNKGGYPIVKVHGLAETGLQSLRTYPWDSVDSAQWGKLVGMGRHLYVATGDFTRTVLSFRKDGQVTGKWRELASLTKDERAYLAKVCAEYDIDPDTLEVRDGTNDVWHLTLSMVFFKHLERVLSEKGPRRFSPPKSLVRGTEPMDLPAIQTNGPTVYLGMWLDRKSVVAINRVQPNVLLSYAYAGMDQATRSQSGSKSRWLFSIMGVPENERD